jgi:hypothetical protein
MDKKSKKMIYEYLAQNLPGGVADADINVCGCGRYSGTRDNFFKLGNVQNG